MKLMSAIKFTIIGLLVFFCVIGGTAQNLDYAKKIVKDLASEEMHGRGYVNNGVEKAAEYIKNELKQINIAPKGEDEFSQQFDYPVNTFPDKMIVKFDNQTLVPGKDFYVDPYSQGVKGTFKPAILDAKIIKDPTALEKFFRNHYKTDLLLVDDSEIEADEHIKIVQSMWYNPLKAKIVMFVSTNKLSFGVATDVAKHTIITVAKNSLPKNYSQITINIENKYIKSYKTENIIGIVEGSIYPDSVIVFTAHYDHLGHMGKETYIPGANDNASGVAMLLDLAKYYANEENEPAYSIAFMFLSGEEAGLKGSIHYIQHPTIPLKNIKFLINLDLVGTGDEGIKIVNSAIFLKEYTDLVMINNQYNYLPAIKKRGEAANSDHYPFYAKGVPAFFIYTLGGISAYHDIYDKYETLPFTKYEGLFRLLRDFIESFE